MSGPSFFHVPALIRQRPNDTIDTMPISTDLRPLTNYQAVRLRHDLTLVEERLHDIATLMRVCYGEDSQAVIRADETTAALQRLKWELERSKLQKQAAGSA
jgi:Trm5-related predicted tRNA methylase